MKKIAIAIAAVISVAVPAAAQNPQEVVAHTDHEPTAPLHLDEWAQRTSQNISESLERIEQRRIRIDSGVTYVRFTCDEEGKPTNVETSMRGASPSLDRAGRLVVRNLRSMHPLFVGASEGQIFEAAIVVARDERELRKLTAEVQNRAQQQKAYFAARGVPNPVMSIAIAGSL